MPSGKVVPFRPKQRAAEQTAPDNHPVAPDRESRWPTEPIKVTAYVKEGRKEPIPVYIRHIPVSHEPIHVAPHIEPSPRESIERTIQKLAAQGSEVPHYVDIGSTRYYLGRVPKAQVTTRLFTFAMPRSETKTKRRPKGNR